MRIPAKSGIAYTVPLLLSRARAPDKESRMAIVLKVEHLKKRYGQLEAVKDVGCEVG